MNCAYPSSCSGSRPAYEYLQAGFVAALPAICGILGGVLSDTLLRRGNSLTLARKIPIVVGLLRVLIDPRGTTEYLCQHRRITTPIVIGYIVEWIGSFDGVLLYVAANASGATLSFLLIMGRIERVPLAFSARITVQPAW